MAEDKTTSTGSVSTGGLWKTILDIFNAGKPCRLALIVVSLLVIVFISVEQASEVLRCLGEGPAYTGGLPHEQFLWCMAGLTALSLCAWYMCRVLLYLQFVDSPPPTRPVKAVILWLPRIIGVIPAIGLGFAFRHAAVPYASDAGAATALRGFGWVCFGTAVLLLLFFFGRRHFYEKGRSPAQRASRFFELPKLTRSLVIGAVCVSISLFLLIQAAPVPAAHALGSAAVILFAAAAWVVFGSIVIYFGHRLQIPVILVTLIITIAFSRFNDNHAIRQLSGAELLQTPTLTNYYKSWYGKLDAAYPNETPHPVFLVAAAGGGIRAAYWTAKVLAELQDSNPAFSDHVFAISGVSGGSLGAVVFDCLIRSGVSHTNGPAVQAILSQDFLAPTLSYMLFPDLFQRFLPFGCTDFDRAKALEQSWEQGWMSVMKNGNFEKDFDWLWRGEKMVPALFLNGTSVEDGNRMILSNVLVDEEAFLDSQDIRSNLTSSVSLSTAVDMSARFTYVSPAGRFPTGKHIVDGGYFENSGGATLADILYQVNRANTNNPFKARVILLVISNDPKAAMERSTHAKHPKFLHETMSPVRTLLATRSARGIFSVKDLETDVDPTNVFHFALTNNQVPLPLGWSLSQSAVDEMNDQLRLQQADVDMLVKLLP